MITKGLSSNALGQVGEAAVNIAKGLPDGKALPQKAREFSINERNRIADGVNIDGKYTEMWEVKNVKTLDGSYKTQIQDYLDHIAEVKASTGRDINYELYIRGPGADVPTHITGPMDTFLKENGIQPKYIEDLY